MNRYTYDIWGNLETTEETVPNVLRYAREYWDEVTGLQYLRVRWYDPFTARFINEDTVEGQLTNPLSLNLYTYVENNPLIYVDFSGESKRPAKNSLEGLGAGSGSASAGAGRSSGGSFGGGGSKGGSGSAGSKPKPSTSSNGQANKTTGTNSSSVTVSYGNSTSSVYRGGKTFEVKTNEVKLDKKTGLVKTTHGVSLDTNPGTVSKFGGAYKIESIPDGLKIIQRGSRLEHFEIVPAYDMSLKMYQDLLNLIKVSPVK